MARRYETITELYHKTIAGLATPQAWQSFLTTACHNFRLPFDEQVLLYAQRPNATAVLTIDGRNGWNQRFGRWVNRGATGIAVFDGDSIGRSRLKYYFDISDTHESRFSRPVPIWTMRPEYESAVVEALENSFGELVDKNSFAAALLSASQNAVQDNMPDYLAELKYYKENSFLEELDDLNIEVEYRRALENSIGFMLLTRCGIDPAEYFTEDDFRDIADFSTPETLNALGTATGDIGQMCFSVISRTVLPLQRQAQRETGTFAPVPNIQYSETENRTTTPERSENHERTDLHDAERIPTARSASAPGAGNAPWEIRIAEEDIPEAAPQSDLHESADIGQTEPTSDGDRADSTLPDGIANRPDGESRGRDGGAESQRPDEVDRTDEQHSERSGGADSERTDLPLNPESMENAGGDELPAFLNETLIMAIISNKDDDLKYKKQQIELYFSIHPEETERAEYLKSAYQDRYTEIVVDGVRVGYKPQENGLLMWEGAYLSRTSESVFSWSVVAEWTAQLIDKKEYFINTQITPPKSQESQQLTLFDLADFNTPAQEVVGQFSFMPRPQLSQQIIDEALCIGSNEPQSRLIICAYFMKDHTMEENAQFLAAHYGENGAGFYVNDRQYALWYNTDGIRIASGDSAQGRNVALLTWEQAAKRIRELLDLGRYMPQSELDMVSDHELRTLADRMLLLSRDISEEYWDAGYLPTMRLIHSSRQGFPEMVDQLQKLLIDPDMLQKIAVEWKTFADTHAQNPDILRFRFYRPKEISNQLQNLQREPVTFIAAEDYNPQRHFYISGDEIDKVLRGSSADYRLGVYSFFANHPDQKESEKYLRDYHGEYSGYHGGNDNRVYTSKGLSFSHGDLTQPYAKVELKWNFIAKRIGSMISQDRFLSEKDREAMADYEIKQLARSIHRFFMDAPELYPRPYHFNAIADYWEGVQEVAEQLGDPACVEEIYQMMLPLWEGTPQDDRHYQSRKIGLENMQAYRDGTYSVFNLGHTIRPLATDIEVPVVESKLPELPAEEQQSESYHDLAVELLHFYQEFDPYGYRDSMELGETDADALISLEQQLRDPEQRKGILDTLQSYLDNTDPEEEIAADLELFMERIQELPDLSRSNTELEEARQLINEYCLKDLAQRLGRIVRQGNMNPEVEIFRYVTEGTFDAYLYQLVENKQKFIAQIMTSKAPVRVADDVDETALSYSEIKALATGNPLIIEKCNLDMDVGKLNMLKASYLSQKYALEEMVLRKYPEAITRLTERIAGYQQDVQLAAAHPKPKDAFAGITILDQPYADKEAAGKAILDVCTKMTGSNAVFLGQYRGFSLTLSYDGTSNEYRMTMKGTLSHTAVLGADVFGNLTRMDNVIDGLPGKLEAVRAELAETQVQIENARSELAAPFAREAELTEKTARLKELNILLNMDQKDNALIDDAPDEEALERPRSKGMER